MSDNSSVTETDFNEFKVVFYISVGILGGVCAIIIGLLIGAYVWLSSLSKLQVKTKEENDPYKDYFKKYPSIPRMNPMPGEELSKRYVMNTGNDYDTMPSQHFSRNPLTSRSMIEKRMSSSVIGELNNRISNQGPKSNGFYGSETDSFPRSGKQDVIYYAGGSEKERNVISAY